MMTSSDEQRISVYNHDDVRHVKTMLSVLEESISLN